MGTLTIAVSGSGVVNGSKSYTINDVDMQHWIDCLIAQGGAATAQQALLAWANGVVSVQISQVQRFMRAQQVKAIVVSPIKFT